jgi:hypothetical protein
MWDDEDLQQLFQQYLTGGGGGLLSRDDGAVVDPSMLRTSAMDRIASNPLVQFGMGVFANNQGHYGQLGPALGGGMKSMVAASQLQQRSDLQRAQLLGKYQQQVARQNAIEKLNLSPEQKQMMAADPALARKMLTQSMGLDVMSPQAEQQKARIAAAGKTSVAVNMKPVIQLGEDLATQNVKILRDSRDQALAATKSMEAANQIVKSAQSPIFAGPGGSWMQRGAQFLDVVGAAGNTTQERIANTRSVIRNMSKIVLQASSSAFEGQGSVSNYERELAAKAEGGGIDDMTAPEIMQLATAAQRSSELIYGQHQSNLQAINEMADAVDPEKRVQLKAYTKMFGNLQLPQKVYRAPTQAAIAKLRQNDTEEERAAFERTFGPGSAAQYLGAP